MCNKTLVGKTLETQIVKLVKFKEMGVNDWDWFNKTKKKKKEKAHQSLGQQQQMYRIWKHNKGCVVACIFFLFFFFVWKKKVFFTLFFEIGLTSVLESSIRVKHESSWVKILTRINQIHTDELGRLRFFSPLLPLPSPSFSSMRWKVKKNRTGDEEDEENMKTSD